MFFKRSKPVLWASYVIFGLALVIISYLFFSWQNAKANLPFEIYFERNKSSHQVQVHTTFQTNYQPHNLRKNVSGQDILYWEYGFATSSARCQSDAWRNSGHASITVDSNRAPVRQHLTITYQASRDSNQYLCLKALYRSVNAAPNTFQTHRAVYFIDDRLPVITKLSQNVGGFLEAHAQDDSRIISWSVASATTQLNCQSSQTSYTTVYRGLTTQQLRLGGGRISRSEGYAVNASARLLTKRISGSDNGRWYCVKAEDLSGNIGYSSQAYRVDAQAPILSMSRSGNIVTVSVNDQSVDINDWRYVAYDRSAENNIDCHQLGVGRWRPIYSLTNDYGSHSIRVNLNTEQLRNQHYCFRVLDSSNNYGYLYVHLPSTSSVGSTPLRPTSRSIATEQVVGQTPLVRAQGLISQAILGSSWRVVVTTSATCNAASFTGGATVYGLSQGFYLNGANHKVAVDLALLKRGGVSETASSNKYLCFKVYNGSVGHDIYGSLDVDLAGPQITFEQNQRTLTASATDIGLAGGTRANNVNNASWKLLTANCQATLINLGSTKSITLNNSHLNTYVCFQVSDIYGNQATKRYYVSSLGAVTQPSKPIIYLGQSSNRLTFSSPSNNVNSASWVYAKTTSRSVPSTCNPSHWTYLATQNNHYLVLNTQDIGTYICIGVANYQGVYNYSWFKVGHFDQNTPNISVRRQNNYLITSSAAQINPATWQYAVSAVNANTFDCSSTNAALRFNQPSSSNSSVRLTSADTGRYYCFRVADYAGVFGYAKSGRILNVQDAPLIQIIQDSNLGTLRVFTHDPYVNGLTWGWASFSSNPGNCASVNHYNSVNSQQVNAQTSQITVSNIEASQNGYYYCFRVSNTLSTDNPNYGYVKHQYSLDTPIIDVHLTSAGILTISSPSSNLRPNSWRYAIFKNRPNCQQKDLNIKLPASGKLSLNKNHNDSYFCVKVTDKNGQTTTRLFYINGINQVVQRERPVIRVTRAGNTLTATSTSSNVDSNSWRWTPVSQSGLCHANGGLTFRFNATTPNVVNLDNFDTSSYRWFCFKVSNIYGDTGYREVAVDYTINLGDKTAPVLTAQQNGRWLTIKANEEVYTDDWYWAQLDDGDINCNWADYQVLPATSSAENIADTTKSGKVELTTDLVGQDICIRAKDLNGNLGYIQVRIKAFDTDAPKIILRQANDVLEIWADNVQSDSWQYIHTANNIDCSAKNSAAFKNLKYLRLALSEKLQNTWYCIKVTGLNGVDGYNEIQIGQVDVSLPKITLKQTAQTLTATANEKIKLWQYVVIGDDDKCEAQTFVDHKDKVKSGAKVTLKPADNEKTYCFKAVDENDKVAFKSHKIVFDKVVIAPDPTPGDGIEERTDDDDNDIAILVWLLVGAAVISIVVVIIMKVIQDKNQANGSNRFDDESSGGLPPTNYL